jgi:hypothetical protein
LEQPRPGEVARSGTGEFHEACLVRAWRRQAGGRRQLIAPETQPDPPTPRAGALEALLAALAARGYSFTTPGHGAIRRMRERARPPATLRDVFGWSLPFRPRDLPAEIVDILQEGGLAIGDGDTLSSRVRVSQVEGQLFAHSAFPTLEADSVFLGPDSYRFAALIREQTTDRPAPRRLADIGAGAGVGGLVAARLSGAQDVVLTDINARALTFAAANAAHGGQTVTLCQGRGLSVAYGEFDLIVANPPFIAGTTGQTYKAGGDLHGARVSLDWAVEGMERLAPGGRMILYTGSPILLGGEDALRAHLARAAAEAGCDLRYRELDPDIFSSELRRDAYDEVERIAAVGAVLRRPA